MKNFLKKYFTTEVVYVQLNLPYNFYGKKDPSFTLKAYQADLIIIGVVLLAIY